MKQVDFIIVGAGLSGLLAGKRLKNKGYTVQVLEARDRIGGRIHTLKTANETPVEMGATWFGAQHVKLIALLKELEIPSYEQFMEGAAYFEAFSTAPPQQINFPKQAPSYRIKGGTSALIDKLASELSEKEIFLGRKVEKITFNGTSVQVISNNQVFEAKRVISTLAPALLMENISFEPALSEQLIENCEETHTWMHDSIKVALSFKTPFWRQKKLSGTIFSNVGPITEFYDHCNEEVSTFALCGFVNGAYASLDEAERKQMVLNQLTKTFGEVALDFLSYEETVWKNEEFTSPAQNNGLFPHQNNGHPIFQKAIWDNHLFIAGTETSSNYGGYMDGAVARIEEIVRIF